MAHEKLIEQYSKDCTEHLRPWELWQYRFKGEDRWRDFFNTHPKWLENVEYRRKEPPFVPEYFSGLNWRDAENLVGKVVEFSDDPDNCGWEEGVLKNIQEGFTCKFRLQRTDACYTYIRTTPQTHAHPTITIGGVELPRPEVEAPEEGAEYWLFDPTDIGAMGCYYWLGGKSDLAWLKFGCVHLTKDRALAWADWWQNTVIAVVRGGE